MISTNGFLAGLGCTKFVFGNDLQAARNELMEITAPLAFLVLEALILMGTEEEGKRK